MKFDKRNPFAAWGFEQEVYTKDSENTPVFEGMKSMENSAFVNDGEDMTVKEATFTNKEAFFTNNENMVDPALIRRRMVDGEDVDYKMAQNYNNVEMNYYGIEPQDLMANTKGEDALEYVTAEEAIEANKELPGAIDDAPVSTDDVEEAQKEADTNEDGTITDDEANAYNAGLDGAVKKGDVKQEEDDAE